MKMNKEAKILWVEALRSGEYLQGKGKLEDVDGSFCCLGVLCKVAEKQGIKPEYSKVRSFIHGEYTLYGTVFINQPLIKEWTDGLPVEITSKLMEMNDGSNKSFLEIADYIEINL